MEYIAEKKNHSTDAIFVGGEMLSAPKKKIHAF